MTEYYTDNQGGRHAIPDTWSFSRWAAWDECAFKYRAKFILKVPEPQSPAMARGDRVHRALDSYITGRGPLPPEITSDFHKQLYGEMRDFTGRKLVEQKWGFSRNWRETGWMGNTTWLRAVCDVVMLYDDDSLEVVDHKTGKVYGDNSEQVELFALTAFERFGVAAKNGVKTRLIYVDSDQEQEAFYPGDDMDRIRAKWTLRAEKMLNDRKWLPRAGCRCKFCNMRVAGELRAY